MERRKAKQAGLTQQRQEEHSVVIQPSFQSSLRKVVSFFEPNNDVLSVVTGPHLVLFLSSSSSFTFLLSPFSTDSSYRIRTVTSPPPRNRIQFRYLVWNVFSSSHPQIAFYLRMTFKITFFSSSLQSLPLLNL